jgi:hypothetical protein
VAAFLVLLTLAAQVLLGLYTTSVVGTVAFDAAKTAAGADALQDPSAREQAAAQARARLGVLGRQASFRWAADADTVALTVRVPGPGVLPRFFTRDIVRTARVRAERVR